MCPVNSTRDSLKKLKHASQKKEKKQKENTYTNRWYPNKYLILTF